MPWNLYLHSVLGFHLLQKPPNITQTTVPKIPPSTPVFTQDTTENEKKQTEVVTKPNEINNQQEQQVKQPATTTAPEGEFNDFPDEDNES
jgi:hypothetical protein